MAVIDRGFDGSIVTIGSSSVGNLTEFHNNNSPTMTRTSGADAAAHSFVAGRSNESVTIGFLGSKCNPAGSAVAIAATLNDGTSFSGTGVLTQVRVSGRKDGAIEGSLTAKPTVLSPVAGVVEVAEDVSFNGTHVTFNSVVLGSGATGVAINSCTYEGTCAEVDDAGAGDSSVLTSPGIPDETLTVEVMGGATLTKGTRAALTVVWNDGGSIGTQTYAQLMTIRNGGGVDDAITTEYVFKRCKSSSA